MARNLDEPGANFNQLLELSIKLQNARTFADASTEMEQYPDTYLRPGETLEDWTGHYFRKPNAAGGRIYGGYAQQIADGGRVGYKDGRTVGNIVDVRNVPYYSGKALQGLVNSAETLSKLPFAAGELGSKLIQQPPNKKMFMEAIENITPGSWSENVGLTSLVEGMAEKRSPEAKAVGNVLGLGTEIAVPTGGAFKAGQFLLNKASKAMGKVKDGKTLNKLVDQKLTDAGQSRRDFNIMAATSGLMVALKSIGLGGILKTASKTADDFTVKLRTTFHNSDVDYGTSGLAFFDISALTPKVKKVLYGLMKNRVAAKGPGKVAPKDYLHIEPGDAKFVIKELQDAGFKGRITGIVDEGGDVLKQAEKADQKNFVKTYKKQSMKQNVKDHQRYNDYVVYENDPGFMNWKPKAPNFEPFKSTIDEVVEMVEPIIAKAKGGRIYGEYAQQLASGGRVGYQGGDIVPKPKPKDYAGTLKMLLSQEAWNTLGARTWTDLTFDYAKKAREAGQISDKTYKNLMMPLFGETGEKITKAIAKHDAYDEGGRVKLKKGGWSPGAGRDERGYKSDHPSRDPRPGGGDPGMTYIKRNKVPKVNEPPYIPEPVLPKIKKAVKKKIEPIFKEGEKKQKDYFFNKKLWDSLEKYKTLPGHVSQPPPWRGRSETPFTSRNILDSLATLSLKYPNIKMTDKYGYINKENAKQVIDQAYFDGSISLGDSINITRTLDTMGEGVTGIGLDTKYLDISGLPEANKYTIGSQFNVGDLGLSYTGNLLDNDITKQGLAFNYDDKTLTGGITKDYENDYTLSKLGLDKTFDLNDVLSANIKGDISNLRYDGENYIDSSLTPGLNVQLPVGSGILKSNIAKNIIEGGETNLGASLSYPFAGGEFKAGASDILSDNPEALLGYSYEKGDPYSNDPYFEVKANWDPIEGNKNLFFGVKKQFNEGGRVGLTKGGMTPSEKWMRNYFYSGKGGYDDRMSFSEFQIGPGIDLWHRFGKSN